MYWGFWRFGPGLWLLGGLFWIVIWALLIWGLTRWFSSRKRRMPFYLSDQPPVKPSALEILRQRYARGEIDAATFEQMRERLENTGGPREQ
jgi:putative membrane protein